jgi:phospholipid transport system substrate-binding protein
MAHRLWVTLLLALSLIAFPVTAFAAGATDALKDKQNELITLLKKPKSADNDKKIEGVFDALIDYDTLAKESLAGHWDELSEEQRKEFRELLKRLVRNAYRKNLRKTLTYDVKYTGEDPGKKGVVVHTKAKNKKNAREDEVSIDYALHEVGGKWMVYDIVTEGSSTVSTYRAQFTKVIKKNGFAELMKKLKKKADKDGA